MALNPELARDIGKIEGVAQATEDLARATFELSRKGSGLTENELREALGEPSLADRLAEITKDLGEAA